MRIAAAFLCCACSGSTVGSIGKGDPGTGTPDAGSSGGARGLLIDASQSSPEGGMGGALIVEPRDSGADRSDVVGCTAITTANERLPVDVLIALERSDATEELIPGTATTWWAATVAGIRSVTENSKAFGNELGIEVFPRGSDGAACGVDYSTPDIPFASLSPQAAQSIETILMSRAPAFGRPTGPALEGAVAHMQTRVSDQASGRIQAIALVTRGEPDMCIPSAIADLKSYMAAIDGAPVPASFYTIALGPEARNMTEIGLGDPKFFYVPGGDVEKAVGNALLRTLFPDKARCSILFPQPPGIAPLDPDRIVVTLESYTAGQALVYRVLSAADCDRYDGRGWFLGSADASPTIELCPATCADMPGDLKLYVGCIIDPVR